MRPTFSFRQKLFRSSVVIAVAALIVAPPLVFPPARPFYVPLHDNLWLTAVGYLWYLLLPFSAFFLLAGGILALGGWLAWLFGKQPLASLQGRLAHAYIRLQPSLALYRAGAAAGIRLCVLKGSLPERWRTRFPVSILPNRYGDGLPDTLLVRIADRVWNDWAIQCWTMADAEGKRRTALRLVTLSRGLAALFIPGDKFTAVLQPVNESFALAYLDNATPYNRGRLLEKETLFRRLLSQRFTLNPDHLTAFSVYEALARPLTEDRITLLRALIGLWEETRQPDVAATVIQQFSRYLDDVANRFSAHLTSDTAQTSVETPIQIPSAPVRLFTVRYLAFLGDAYGAAATLCASDHLSRLAQLAERVLAHPSPTETPYETASPIRTLAHPFVEVDTVMDAYRKVFAWQTRTQRLARYQETAQRSLLSAAYSNGDPDLLRTVLPYDQPIEPSERV